MWIECGQSERNAMICKGGETVSENYTMLYSGNVNAEKDVSIVMRNDIVTKVTKM